MKFSEAWLREFVDPPWDTQELCTQLTMTGLEVDELLPAAQDFTGVVVGEITEVSPHPDADKLSVCVVHDGSESRSIVCGAPNVYAGMKAPLAVVGAKLPGDLKIRKTKLRGVESQGMLCSGKELGLTEDSDGILDLPMDATVGQDFRTYLRLDDHIFDLDLTPNRGDCLSLLGVAREVAAMTGHALPEPDVSAVDSSVVDTLGIRVEAFEGCPKYAGRVVRDIRSDVKTPMWMQEKLRRSGLRPIHPVVDITNYVMLELGQPMHAFDLSDLTGSIVVRYAKPGEEITLLDGAKLTLEPDVLAICDEAEIKALAGIMGGLGSGVRDDTQDIFFESAYFDPQIVARRARRFGLHTDASHRFERGVDPDGQVRAIERATELLLEIAGGKPGPVSVVASPEHQPARGSVGLRRARIGRLLGIDIPDATVHQALTSLGMSVETTPEGWNARPPSHRFDIEVEEDLIEEVARLHGYDNIPEYSGGAVVEIKPRPETRQGAERFKSALVDRGYREAITYSFFDPEYQKVLFPNEQLLALSNPISEDLSAMRVSLWPGLLDALNRNLRRQRDRVRLFEFGTRFLTDDSGTREEMVFAGVICGSAHEEGWHCKKRSVDFFDIKSDVDALLALGGNAGSHIYEKAELSCLHPSQSARIKSLTGTPIGWLGALHPGVQKTLQIERKIYLFELQFEQLSTVKVPSFEAISKFPEIRRDIAIIVNDEVSVAELCATARDRAGPTLRKALVFDVYRGAGIDMGRKSVALGLILQDKSRTLTDEDADKVVSGVVAQLQKQHNALIRD